MLAILAILAAGPVFGQPNLNFNNVTATSEGAIRLSWNSTSNEIYEIDEADELNTNADGTTAWNTLYTDYPSQGTNTFWLDTGNNFSDPEISHPSQSPARFYRIVLTGTNTTPTVPLVSVSSPTNGTFSTNGSLTVTVNASTDQVLLATKLYVDGQEMQPPDVSTNYTDGGTNYVTDTYFLNTSEWPNGTHVVFATASCQTGAGGTRQTGDIGIGYGVSAFVPVTFSNLISRISFSQPFFAPEDGQTQQVTAVFAANVDWTLQIQDVNTNTVRTVTGNGGSMLVNWDGTGDGGTNLPVGNYTYLLTAETNGQALPIISGGGSGGGGSPPSPSFASASSFESADSTQWLATRADGLGPVVPLALYPPGFDTNNLVIFAGSLADYLPQGAPLAQAESSSTMDSGSGASPNAYSGSSSQSNRSPKRPPINPVRGRAGVYGLAYQTYTANGSGFTIAPPDNGLHVGLKIGLEDETPGNSTFTYPPLRAYKREADNFIVQMKKGNWSQGFAKVDDQLGINDLRSSGPNIFNTVKLGLLMLHGTYGNSLDYSANQAKQIYFPVTSGHSAKYIGMAEMKFGSAATNGLKWMGILACSSMDQADWSSMQNKGVKPYNSDLHLILGTDSEVFPYHNVAAYWAKYMTVGKINGSPMTIQDAWIIGAIDAYAETGYNWPVAAMRFAASGSAACQNDRLQSSSTPSGGSFYNNPQVWP
jgi:hypothetical protein